jgi:hypothetical protein
VFSVCIAAGALPACNFCCEERRWWWCGGGNVEVNEREDGTVEGTPKRLGRKRKKVQGGKVHTSYGLSPHAAAPKRFIEYYSKAAVKVASTSATKPKSSKQKAVDQGVELQAPGCQAKVDFRPYGILWGD